MVCQDGILYLWIQTGRISYKSSSTRHGGTFFLPFIPRINRWLHTYVCAPSLVGLSFFWFSWRCKSTFWNQIYLRCYWLYQIERKLDCWWLSLLFLFRVIFFYQCKHEIIKDKIELVFMLSQWSFLKLFVTEWSNSIFFFKFPTRGCVGFGACIYRKRDIWFVFHRPSNHDAVCVARVSTFHNCTLCDLVSLIDNWIWCFIMEILLSHSHNKILSPNYLCCFVGIFHLSLH